MTFNTWISENAENMKQRLSQNFPVDADAFQDAYLSLASDFFEPESSATFEKAFIELYRRIANRYSREIFETSHPEELFFTLLPSEETAPMEQPEEIQDRTPIAKKVQKHIRAAFPQRDVLAFEMRLKGFSFRDIADTLGIGTTAINNATDRIITQTRLQFAAVAL